MALPRDAMGLSTVCDCGNSESILQYKCLVLILKIMNECIVSNDQMKQKQFSLEIKSYSPFWEMTLFTVRQTLISLE